MKLQLTGMLTLAMAWSITLRAHLCDDVFSQARDNLAVKVDVRDGQLRVGREGSFRVYVLNTMDRNIAEITLLVNSAEFDAEVKPSPEWRGYPVLATAARGNGKREYFTVQLKRKPGVPDGAYRIELDLYSNQMKKSFMKVQLDDAADIIPLPLAKNMVIDGNASRDEWAPAKPCAGFTSYQKKAQFFENVPARWQTRVRTMHDAANLYVSFSLDLAQEITGDLLTICATGTPEATPKKLVFDRSQGTLTVDGVAATSVKWATNAKQNVVELCIPKQVLGLVGQEFYLNFTRAVTTGKQQDLSYWRGNEHSSLDGMVYSHFVAANP